MSLILKEVIFRDLDPIFKMHPVTKDVVVLSNVNAIKRSIRNLVLTNRYEKFYKPSVYSGVLDSLFENFDPILISVLQDKIKEVLQYEKRAQINSVEVSDEQLDNNAIIVTINFTPLNSKRQESIDIFLQRIR